MTLPYEIVRTRVSEVRCDPHDDRVEWRYDGKWGLHLRGLPGHPYWSWSGAESLVPTPERIALWYALMRSVTSPAPSIRELP